MCIPQDVAFVGFDDLFFAAYVSPPLTTVRLPAYGLGWAAGDMLIRLISEDEPVERRMFLTPVCAGNSPCRKNSTSVWRAMKPLCLGNHPRDDRGAQPWLNKL
jgi:DNA-binding LacI/PurR family transcriptional regulator